MIYYASRTGTKRNLAAIRDAGIRLLVSCAGEWRTEGFPYCLDPGTWTDHKLGREIFDGETFQRFIDELGPGGDFIIAPDIVAGGLRSLVRTVEWLDRCKARCALVLIAVQDGMHPVDVVQFIGPNVGIFLGGSTEWKVEHMEQWGAFCAKWGCHYHVGRANSRRRLRLAIASGAATADGSGPARFAKHTPKVARWMRQRDLFTPPMVIQ